MNADNYNSNQLSRALIDPEHLTQLTLLAQPQLGLDVDGKCGPATRAALEARMGGAVTVSAADHLGLSIVAAARSEIGQGETVANNRSPYLESIGAIPGEPWCAAAVSHWIREGCKAAGVSCPIRGSLGAKHLADQIAEAGHEVTNWLGLRAGDVICTHRGKAGSQSGHIRLVAGPIYGGLMPYIAGNEGVYPARVHALTVDVTHLDVYKLASLRPR